jgi:hypothetical protein
VAPIVVVRPLQILWYATLRSGPEARSPVVPSGTLTFDAEIVLSVLNDDVEEIVGLASIVTTKGVQIAPGRGLIDRDLPLSVHAWIRMIAVTDPANYLHLSALPTSTGEGYSR